MNERIRVLVVDDSPFARKVIRKVLEGAPGIEVVGIARDGLEALEKIDDLAPDVVTLDLVMPHVDGMGVLDALPKEGGPRVLVVSVSDADSAIAIRALERGAIDVVQKPTALASDRLYELGDELVRKVTTAALAKAAPSLHGPVEPVPRAPIATGSPTVDLVVIGTSTGGPQALTRLVRALPKDFPCPVAVALHIPAGYTEALSNRLNDLTPLSVVEAREGLEFKPGQVVIAMGGMHLEVVRSGSRLVAHLDVEPMSKPHRPSVDVLFESASAACGGRTLGVVLTGMGDDGLAGSRAIRMGGGRVLTEAESSCVVYGMPRAVDLAGLSSGSVALERMAAAIADEVTR